MLVVSLLHGARTLEFLLVTPCQTEDQQLWNYHTFEYKMMRSLPWTRLS